MTPEGRVAKSLKDLIRSLGGQTRKVSWEGRNNAPDLLCMLNGRHCFAETKAPGQLPRRGQAIEMRELERFGFRCFVVDGEEGVNTVISYLNGEFV